jgi:hypothetical protein
VFLSLVPPFFNSHDCPPRISPTSSHISYNHRHHLLSSTNHHHHHHHHHLDFAFRVINSLSAFSLFLLRTFCTHPSAAFPAFEASERDKDRDPFIIRVLRCPQKKCNRTSHSFSTRFTRERTIFSRKQETVFLACNRRELTSSDFFVMSFLSYYKNSKKKRKALNVLLSAIPSHTSRSYSYFLDIQI